MSNVLPHVVCTFAVQILDDLYFENFKAFKEEEARAAAEAQKVGVHGCLRLGMCVYVCY